MLRPKILSTGLLLIARHVAVNNYELNNDAPLMPLYFCRQNQNAKNIGNFTTLFKHHNFGTHLKGIETSFQVVSLFSKSLHFSVSYITF
jgi:hypothetical protein